MTPFPASAGPRRVLRALILAVVLLVPVLAEAQIAFRSASRQASYLNTLAARGSGAVAVATSGNVTPALPAGWEEGDIHLAVIETRDNVAISMPAGWAHVTGSPQTIGANHRASLLWKIARPGDGNPVVTHTGGSKIVARIFGFSGANQFTPFDATNTFTATGTASTITTASALTTVTANAVLVMTAHMADQATGFTGPTPGTWTLVFSSSGTGTTASIALAYRTVAAGTQGPFTLTRTGAAAVSTGGLAALRPPLTIDIPTGTVAGDVMVAAISVRPYQNYTITAPSGWTLVRRMNSAGDPQSSMAVYWKAAGASEPSQYTWTISGGSGVTTGIVGTISSFSGVDTTNPIAPVSVGNAENGQTTAAGYTHTAPSITPTIANTMLVSHYHFVTASTWTLPTTTPATTEAIEVASWQAPNSIGISQVAGYASWPNTNTATGNRTATAASGGGTDAGSGAAHILALRPATSVLTSYSVSFPSGAAGITCAPTDVTITARDGAGGTGNAVNVSAGTVLTLTTGTSQGVWQSTLVSGTGTWSPSNLNNGSATYTWPGGQSTFTVRLRHTLAASVVITATEGPRSGQGTASFADSTFRFVDNPAVASPYAGSAIPVQLSAKPSNVGYNARANLVLQAIRTDSSGACTGIFTGPTAIELAFECVNPGTCQAGQQVSFTAGSTTALPANAAGTVSGTTGTYTAANVTFGADSRAVFNFTFPDAGSIRLHARYRLTPPVSGVTYTYGASGNIVVRPFGLRITGIPSGRTGPASTVFTTAGTSFNTTVTAVAWESGDDVDADGIPDNDAQIASNAVTPSFGLESPASTATVTHTLTEPVGGAAGVLTGGTYTGFSGGTLTQAMTYSEVGILSMFATSANYLGTTDTVRNSVAGLTGVGRFIPGGFLLTPGAVTNRSAAGCTPASAFTYMNEPLQVAFTLRAVDALGVNTTTNYRGTFARLNLTTPAVFSFGARNVSPAANLIARMDTTGGTSGTWGNGITSNLVATLAVRRATPDNPDGPYAQVRFGIAPIDPDNVQLRPVDLNLDADLTGSNERGTISSTDIEVRFGRLRVGNALGSPNIPLPIPLSLEYWNATRFETNAQDSCTRLTNTDIAFSNAQGFGACAASGTPSGANGIVFTGGRATNFRLSPPLARGSVDLTANLVAAGSPTTCSGGVSAGATTRGATWLQGNWGSATYNVNPSGRASFGQYSNSPEIIYLREQY